MQHYCDDRSAEYEWQVVRSGGGAIFKQCFLYGCPDLASDWCVRASSFLPQCPGGVMALYSRHGWSFIRIPGKGCVFHIWDKKIKVAKLNISDFETTDAVSKFALYLLTSQFTKSSINGGYSILELRKR